MEFLNDFLEQEASRMKEFLHQISTRSTQPPSDSILDWPGYIDEGKQLAILHHLLSENIPKLPVPRQNELNSLQNVLDEITKAKMSNSFGCSQTNLSDISQSNGQMHTMSRSENGHINGNSIIKPLGNGERGIMRGVLTPSSLEKNIFRYNDPTVSPLLNQNQENPAINRSQSSIYSNPIQHSHSTSSISTISNHNNYQNHLLSTTVHHHHHKNHAPSPERYAYLQQQQQKQQVISIKNKSIYRETKKIPNMCTTIMFHIYLFSINNNTRAMCIWIHHHQHREISTPHHIIIHRQMVLAKMVVVVHHCVQVRCHAIITLYPLPQTAMASTLRLVRRRKMRILFKSDWTHRRHSYERVQRQCLNHRMDIAITTTTTITIIMAII